MPYTYWQGRFAQCARIILCHYLINYAGIYAIFFPQPAQLVLSDRFAHRGNCLLQDFSVVSDLLEHNGKLLLFDVYSFLLFLQIAVLANWIHVIYVCCTVCNHFIKTPLIIGRSTGLMIISLAPIYFDSNYCYRPFSRNEQSRLKKLLSPIVQYPIHIMEVIRI